MNIYGRLITSHCSLEKKRNKTKQWILYSHHMNKSSTWCFLIKQKRKRNAVKRLGTIVSNGSKSGQIHQTPVTNTDGDPSKSLLFRILKNTAVIC